MPKILDGRIVANNIAAALAKKIKKLKNKPTLAIIQVGDSPASNVYIKRKIKFAEQVGADTQHLRFSNQIALVKLITEINKLNKNKKVHGIIVQLPLPEKLNKHKDEIINTITLQKDVDGLRASSPHTPATARGVLTLLDFYKIKLTEQKAVVVGRSALVGKPIALALLARNATITICHRHTPDLAAETRQADLLVVAAGSPNLIKKQHVKTKQTVIDVGLSLVGDRLVGDVGQEEVRNIVDNISPVPGGVGPMTVASLFVNLLEAYRMLESNP